MSQALVKRPRKTPAKRRQKAAVSAITPADWGLNSGGWFPLIRESFAGAWQRNVTLNVGELLQAGPVWACVTLITFDIAKMGILLQQQDRNGIWLDTENPAYSPVLRKPNDYQNRIQFIQSWMLSKLLRGNTYALKQRDDRTVVRQLYVLDPQRVKPLVAPDGSVFYECQQDVLSGVQDAAVVVPASEIMHDIYVAPYHPLCGVPPTYACGLAATQGLRIRNNSASFFTNRAALDGILVAPGTISAETAKKLEDHWNDNYSGPQNAGKIAALGDGLKFEPLTMTARDAELSSQLNDAAIEVCNAYHVPAYMVGYGPPPNYNNIEALNAQYYAQCLQILIECLEQCMKEGLGLANDLRVQFNLNDLLRTDQATQMKTATDGVKGGVLTPNEARARMNLPPIKGGDTVYLQQQDYSLAALDARDRAQPAPSSSAQTATPPAEPDEPADKGLPIIAIKAIAGHLGRLGLAA